MNKGGATKKPSLLRRRWVWMTAVAAAVFLGGVAVGAGATVTHDANPRCEVVTDVR